MDEPEDILRFKHVHRLLRSFVRSFVRSKDLGNVTSPERGLPEEIKYLISSDTRMRENLSRRSIWGDLTRVVSVGRNLLHMVRSINLPLSPTCVTLDPTPMSFDDSSRDAVLMAPRGNSCQVHVLRSCVKSYACIGLLHFLRSFSNIKQTPLAQKFQWCTGHVRGFLSTSPLFCFYPRYPQSESVSVRLVDFIFCRG